MRCRATLSRRLPDRVMRTRPAVLPDHTGIGATRACRDVRAGQHGPPDGLGAADLTAQSRQPAVAQHRHIRGVDDVPGTCGHHRRRVRGQCRHLLCQAIRAEQIITANQLEELAGRKVGDGVPIRRRSNARSQTAQADPGVFGELLQLLPGAIGGTVIGNHQLEIAEDLGQNRAHRGANERNAVVCRNNNRYPWRHG